MGSKNGNTGHEREGCTQYCICLSNASDCKVRFWKNTLCVLILQRALLLISKVGSISIKSNTSEIEIVSQLLRRKWPCFFF